jgi:hypothetical protein
MHGRELGIGHGANGAAVGVLGDDAATTDVLAVLSHSQLPVAIAIPLQEHGGREMSYP